MAIEKGFLAVGNFDSNVGYAWRLMESFWCNISQQLKPLGYTPHLCFTSISIVPDHLTKENFSIHHMDFTKTGPLNTLAQSCFIWKNNIKFIYLTDFKTIDLRYLFYRIAGAKKIVTHDHSPGTRSLPSPFKLAIKKALHKLSWLCADACFAVSPYVEERLLKVNGVPKHKIFCITNGIPISETQPPQKSSVSNDIKIVTVSRANFYKGIDFAVQVIAKLLKNNANTKITYTLYGDGPNLEEFKELAAKLNISQQVVFAGKVSGIPEKLLSFDIAFHPSKGEAMSLAILEYMRAGLPVVVSSNPSVSSFLLDQQTALIYQEQSIESAVNAMQQLIDSEKLRLQLGVGGWEAVCENFNDKLMLTKFNQCILKTLK